MSNELFTREEALQGVTGKRGSHLMRMIEVRTGYMVVELRRALWLLLNKRPVRERREYDYFDEIRMTVQAQYAVTVHDLERWAEEWGKIVPTDPKVRATTARLLSNKYKITKLGMPRMRAALGLDEPATAAAFQEIFGQTLDNIYSPDAPPDDREFWLKSQEWLTPESLKAVEDQLEWVFLPWGKTLFEEGDRGDRLYVIVNGRVRVFIRNANGEQIAVREMGRGELLGETAIVTEEPRTATVIAVRDTELASITKPGLDRMINHHPGAIIQIARDIFGRLRQTTSHEAVKNNISTIALVPSHPDVPLHDFAQKLASALKQQGQTLHLTAEIVDNALGEGISQIDDQHQDIGKLLWWLNEREAAMQFTLYQAETSLTEWTRRCVRHADLVLIVADATQSPDLNEIEARLFRQDLDLDKFATRRELVLLHPQHSAKVKGTDRWLDVRHVKSHHHMCLHSSDDFRRLARTLRGSSIGLVMGGGFSRGWAHIGVLRALDEAGIRVDMIGGTSIGAMMAACYATGMDYKQIKEFGDDFARRPRYLMPPTVPLMSLIEGHRLNAFYQKALGEDTLIEDLWMSYFCISSNLSTAQMMVHQRGLLWRYARASCSLPTVLPPVIDNGHLLVDGGVHNNLPVDVMARLNGGGPIIAVNVSRRQSVETYDYPDTVTGWQLLFRRMNPFAKSLNAPTLPAIVSRSMIVGSSHLWSVADMADLLIEPPLEQFGLYVPEALNEIVEIGYRAAQEALKENSEIVESLFMT